MDSDPLIVLTGQVPTDFVGNDAFQETDMMGIPRSITKHAAFADEREAVSDNIETAYALANEDRQGPTFVDLPKDVTQGEIKREPAKPTTLDTYDPPEKADKDNVETAADTLMGADRPVILVGGGVVKGPGTNFVSCD
jgi:acetolactate synthase-1/2/3 large subunit